MTSETKPGADIVADAREWLLMNGGRETTHDNDCHRWHYACLIARLAGECNRLREAIRRLADQDATLSVIGGNVTVTMDATITDEEREAIEWAAGLSDTRPSGCRTTLRSLLERTK